MCDALLLPAPNRNHPKSVAINQSGIVSYGSRSHIYFVNFSKIPPSLETEKSIFGAHKGKVTSLSFSKGGETELLSSIGEDFELKIWDLDSCQTVNTTTLKNDCFTEWIYGSANFVLYPLDCRSICKWNLKTGSKIKIKTNSEIPVKIFASNEKMPHILAAGHSNGIISILDVVQEKVLQVLKVHSGEITSLSWSLVCPDRLHSASSDLSLRMWKLGESSPVSSYYFRAQRQRNDERRKFKLTSVCHPNNSNAVICSNLRGDFGEVIFTENKKPEFQPYNLVHPESCKFSYAAFCFTTGVNSYLFVLDAHKMSVWDINKKMSFSQWPFLMGTVYDFCVSSVNPNLLAICNGDGIMRIWDSDATTRFNLFSVYVNYKTKLMTAVWHPIHENILAYGTDEGRVGVIDIFSKRVAYLFETHHSAAVYSLSWGPCTKDPKAACNAYYIYSCGGGTLYLNKEHEPKTTALKFEDLADIPKDLEAFENTYSEVCWKADFSCLCVGSYKGFVDFYNDTFQFLMRYNVQMKSVESLRWHPTNTFKSPSGSPLKSWLACCGYDTDIHLFDTSNIFEEKEIKCVSECVQTLVGHKKRVVSLCWSPHIDEHLASCSKDCTALIWDVLKGSILVKYCGHNDFLNAVQWSIFDPDVIFSGGMDNCLRMWKISEAGKTSDKVCLSAKAFRTMKKPSSKKTIAQNSDLEEESGALSKIEKEKSIEKDQFQDEVCLDIIKCHKSSKSAGKGFPKSTLFPQHMPSQIQNNSDLSDCMRLADILSVQKSFSENDDASIAQVAAVLNDEETMKFGPFTDQINALKMLQVQSDYFSSQGEHLLAIQMGVMGGNVEPYIQEAAEKRKLNSFLVSMALSVSYKFSLEMCEKYAAQLMQERQFYTASSYYLMCGKLYEAIQVLADKGNIIDALVLAKARLPSCDPVISNLLGLVIKKYSSAGFRTVEAKCCLALQQPLRAAKALAVVGDSSHLMVAAYICRQFALEAEANQYAFQSLERCLEQLDWPAFYPLAAQETKLLDYAALVTVHENFYQHVRQLKRREAVSAQTLFSEDPKRQLWKGSYSIESEDIFVQHTYKLLVSRGLIPTEMSSLEKMIENLKIFSSKRRNESSDHAHISVSICITEFILLMLLGNEEAAKKSLLKIFSRSHNVVFLSRITFMLLFPFSLWDNAGNISYELLPCNAVDETEDKLLKHFTSIMISICKYITSFQLDSSIEPLFEKGDLSDEPLSTTLKVEKNLVNKPIELFMLAYFSAFMVQEIERLSEKSFKIKCMCSYNNPKEKKLDSVEESTSYSNQRALSDESFNNNIGKTNLTNSEEHVSSCKHREIISEGSVENDVLNIASYDSTYRSSVSTETSLEISGNGSNNSFENELYQSCFTSSKKVTFSDTFKLEGFEIVCSESFDPKCSSSSTVNENVVQANEISKNEIDIQTLIDVALEEADKKAKDISRKEKCALASSDSQSIEMGSEVGKSELQANLKNVIQVNENPSRETLELLKKNHDDNNPSSPDNFQQVDSCNSNDIVSCVDIENEEGKCLMNTQSYWCLMKFALFCVCREEYILLYHFRERLRSIHCKMASQMLSKVSREKTIIPVDSSQDDALLENVLSSSAEDAAVVSSESPQVSGRIAEQINCPGEIDLLNIQENEHSLQEDIKEISALLSRLEVLYKKFPYPDPLEIIPKIIRCVQSEKKRSQCTTHQEESEKHFNVFKELTDRLDFLM